MADNNDIRGMIDSNDLSAMIEKLKAHPEIVSGVASTLGLGTVTPPSDPPEGNHAPPISDMLSAITPLLSSKGESDPHKNDRLALLIALKPYLNPERREIVDYIIQFSKIGDLIKKVK